MEALINGQKTTFTTKPTLYDLIVQYQLKPEVVIIEHNGRIVKQELWQNTPIQENDKVELISFVGGG